MKTKIIYPLVAAIVAIVIIYSCSSNSATTPTPTPVVVNNSTVSIQNFAFVPDTVRIKAGATISWTNADSAPHTVTELSSLFNSGSMATSQTYKYTFANAGTFSYHCLIHSMMKNGVVIVTN